MNYNMRQYSKEVEKLIITEPKNRLIENVLGLGEEAGSDSNAEDETDEISDEEVVTNNSELNFLKYRKLKGVKLRYMT